MEVPINRVFREGLVAGAFALQAIIRLCVDGMRRVAAGDEQRMCVRVRVCMCVVRSDQKEKEARSVGKQRSGKSGAGRADRGTLMDG